MIGSVQNQMLAEKQAKVLLGILPNIQLKLQFTEYWQQRKTEY